MRSKYSKSKLFNKILQYTLVISFLMVCTLIRKTYKENLTIEIKNDLHNKVNKAIKNLESSLDQVLTLSSHALYSSLYEIKIDTQKNDIRINVMTDNHINFNSYLVYTTIRNICKSNNLVESVYFYDQASGYIFDSKANICHINNYYDYDIEALFQYNTDVSSKPMDSLGCYYRVFTASPYDENPKQLMTVIYSYKNDRHIAVNINLEKYYKICFEELNSVLNADLIFADNSNKVVISTLDHNLITDIRNIKHENDSLYSYKIKNGDLLKTIMLKSAKYDFSLYGVIKQSAIDAMISKSLNSIIKLQFIMFFVYTNFFMLFIILFLRPIAKSIKAILKQGNNSTETVGNEAIVSIPKYMHEHKIEDNGLNSLFSINKLLNTIYYRNMKLNSDVRLFLPVYISKLLVNLLTGKIENVEQVINDLNNCGLKLPYKNDYFTAAIEINLAKNEDYTEKTKDTLIYNQFIIKHCNELFSNGKSGFAVDFNENIIGVVYNSVHGKDDFLNFLSIINKTLFSKFKIFASISIGPKVENAVMLSTSFYKALNALNYRITFDKEEIIDIEKIHINSNPLTKYYYSIKEHLMRYISEGNAEKACLDIEGLFEFIKNEKYNIGFQEAIDVAINLIQSITAKITDNNINIVNILQKSQYEAYNQINNITRNDLKNMLSGIVSRAACCFEIYEAEFVNKSLSMIKKACLFIDRNYTNNISLENVADYIGLNASYFSKLFKDTTGISFVQYLERKRMEEAINMIKNTNMMISEIGLKIGYNSPNYFSKVFKKFTGLTPDKYRQHYSANDN